MDYVKLSEALQNVGNGGTATLTIDGQKITVNAEQIEHNRMNSNTEPWATV